MKEGGGNWGMGADDVGVEGEMGWHEDGRDYLVWGEALTTRISKY